MKHDQANTTSNSGASVKQEDSLPYILGPSIDQQQLDQQALQDLSAKVATSTAAPESQTDNPHFSPQSSNPIAQGQAQVFGDKDQQCEKHAKPFYSMTMPTDGMSSWLWRLESRKSESIFGYA